MSSPKILCITNDFGPRAGGIETFVIGLIERFPYGSVVVYTSSQVGSEPFDAQWLQRFGVRVFRDRSKVLLPTFRVGRAVRRIAQKEGIERAFFGAAAPLALLSHGLRKAGVKKIVALTHGHEVWWAKVWPFSWAMRRIGRGVDHLTYLGEFTRTEISKALSSIDREKLVRIAPGIDTDHFSPRADSLDLRSELGLAQKKVIVSVGRLVHRKGQDYLIKALTKIKKAIPNAHILFVGQGPYESHLRKLAHECGVEGSITFIGRIQYADLPRYIGAGDLFAMPSRSRMAGLEVEGLGIVYLEASACGLPVVGGLSGGAPDAVLEGVTGLSVDGTDSDAIADACVRILSDSELAQTMGSNGRNWIIDQWQWQRWAKEFSLLLK